MAGSPIIQIEGLGHSYSERAALAEVNLDIFDGEIFGFLGPNGSGKTTLLRILCTILPVTQGRVQMLGLDLAASRNEIRKRIAVVFQSPSLDKQLTAEENLRHHGHLYGLRGNELQARIDETLTRFGLAERRHEYVHTFSGGMRRRVEVAKGLLTHPAIFLMDEPSTGLDPAARLDMWQALQQAREQGGVTILVTTHLMDEAERCSRLAIMDQGKLVALGTPAELKERIGGDVITLAGPDLAAIQRSIQNKFAITASQVDNTLRIERPRAHEFVPQLVEALPGLIDSVSIGRPTLEDVFIQMTGRRLSEDTR